MLQKMIEINLENPWWCQIGTASPPLPPPSSSLFTHNSQPMPTLNTENRCTLGDTQLCNSESEHMCSAILVAESTVRLAGYAWPGRGGGGGLRPPLYRTGATRILKFIPKILLNPSVPMYLYQSIT
jgi:hypothetical protein